MDASHSPSAGSAHGKIASALPISHSSAGSTVGAGLKRGRRKSRYPRHANSNTSQHHAEVTSTPATSSKVSYPRGQSIQGDSGRWRRAVTNGKAQDQETGANKYEYRFGITNSVSVSNFCVVTW